MKSMASIYLYAAVLALNLSSTAQEVPNGLVNPARTTHVQHSIGPGRDNSGDLRDLGNSQLVGPPKVNRTFAEKHPPVPYYNIWTNPLNQTAQQFVAILSVLEEEGVNIDAFKDDWP
jgi:hypothetical protein